MDLNDYFDPAFVSREAIENLSDLDKRYAGIDKHTDETPIGDIAAYDLALLGVPEDRNSKEKGCATTPRLFRDKFYALFRHPRAKVIDLGNLKLGQTAKDSYYALRDIVFFLLNKKTLPMIVGGTQDLTYGNYLAYELLDQSVNLTVLDPRFDFASMESGISPENYMSAILSADNKHLFNYTNIGYQQYYVSQDQVDLMDRMFFDAYRLGFVRGQLEESEPLLRDTDLLSIDMASVRQSDAPGCSNPSPNGFYGEELCQMTRYAGLSDRLSSIGFYNINPLYDNNYQTINLSSQALWYFIEGFYSRKQDYPYRSIKEYKKYIVYMNEIDRDMVFYNDPAYGRWWMQVSYLRKDTTRQIIVSCSHTDYERACRQEIPDRWWRIYQKVS